MIHANVCASSSALLSGQDRKYRASLCLRLVDKMGLFPRWLLCSKFGKKRISISVCGAGLEVFKWIVSLDCAIVFCFQVVSVVCM
jgi:hypothetical protein